jgi:nonsense-mediated mRNA decay protein 3
MEVEMAENDDVDEQDETVPKINMDELLDDFDDMNMEDNE